MDIDLSKLSIKSDGTATGTRLFTVDGDEVKGITSLDIQLSAGSAVEMTLRVEGPVKLDLEDCLSSLEVKDSDLITKLRNAGYTVTIDDSDLERELHQADDE